MDLSYNDVRKMDIRLLSPSITRLDVSHNGLETIDVVPSKLQQLAINDNNLKYFSEDQLVFLQKLKLLKLGDNPFYCNCSSQNLFDFISNTKEMAIEDIESVTLNCSSTLQLHQANIEDFCSNHLRNIEILFIMVAFLTLVTSAVIGLGIDGIATNINQS